MPRKMGTPLSISHPELAKEALGWDPSLFSAGSHAMLLWRCSSGHEWEARLSSRAGKDANGCGFCSGKRLLVGVNDLQTTNPEVAKDAYGWDPKTITGRNAKKLKWKCNLDHVWEASVANRTGVNQTGCPVCSNNQINPGDNDFATTHPELLAEVDGWDPTAVFAGSGKVMNWKCKVGHTYSQSLDQRTGAKKYGCPICSGQKLVTGINDLLSTHPEIARQAVGWDPTEFHAGSSKKKTWLCDKGHEWEGLISNRTRTGSGCHYCSNLRVLEGFNDLASTHPEIAKEANGWDPKSKIAGSHEKLSWLCSQGHSWAVSPGSRTSKSETGCPTCSTSGFDPNSESWLYLLKHEEWLMLQIGITNTPKVRMAKHSRLGWEPLEIRGPLDGFVARQWEQDILAMLRTKGVVLGSKKGVGKFDGYTEAWDAGALSVASLKELMKLVEDNE